MNWLVFHIVSGQSYFTGITLFLLAGTLAFSSIPMSRRIMGLSFVLGSLLIVVSSTAIPYWFYIIAGLVSCFWVISQFSNSNERMATVAFITTWVIGAIFEIPYHLVPMVDPVSSRKVAIIGDSVTAGVGDKSETWPNIIARQHNLNVHDISHVGETVASALKRLRQQQIDSSIIILEIGGNDLLGSTSVKKFADGLDKLLSSVSKPERQVLMFELPLPPFRHEYGRVQRQLSNKHGVLLIPKRVFLNIIAGSGSTLDTIHLSQEGHNLMAETVWSLIKTAFPQN